MKTSLKLLITTKTKKEEKIIDDIKDRYRYRMIEDEGNDHTMEDEEDVDDIEESLEKLKQEIKDKGGRPKEGGTYGKDKHPYGRDPLGNKERKDKKEYNFGRKNL